MKKKTVSEQTTGTDELDERMTPDEPDEEVIPEPDLEQLRAEEASPDYGCDADTEDDDETEDGGDYYTEDSLRAYMREIGRFPIMTADEELETARLAASGDAAARERMINCNLRLVVSVAKHFANRGMALEDLIQEGNFGLLKAVERYDYTKGYRFTTYATWWIRQHISRALSDKSRLIRLPVHMGENIRRINRTAADMLKRTGREPTEEEIAQELGIAPEKVREARASAAKIVSMDTPVGEDDDSTMGDFIADTNRSDPSEIVDMIALREQLAAVLETLTPRERRVIELRYGLNGGKAHTLEEVGKVFGVTRERVRQIEAQALRKLRHPSRSNLLSGYNIG